MANKTSTFLVAIIYQREIKMKKSVLETFGTILWLFPTKWDRSIVNSFAASIRPRKKFPDYICLKFLLKMFNLAIFVFVSGVIFVAFAFFANVADFRYSLLLTIELRTLWSLWFPSNLLVKSTEYMMEKFVLFIWIREQQSTFLKVTRCISVKRQICCFF